MSKAKRVAKASRPVRSPRVEVGIDHATIAELQRVLGARTQSEAVRRAILEYLELARRGRLGEPVLSRIASSSIRPCAAPRAAGAAAARGVA